MIMTVIMIVGMSTSTTMVCMNDMHVTSTAP